MNYGDFSNPNGGYQSDKNSSGYNAGKSKPYGSNTDEQEIVTSIFYVFPPNAAKKNIYTEVAQATNDTLKRTEIYEAYLDMLKTPIGKSLWDEFKNHATWHIYLSTCATALLSDYNNVVNTTSLGMTQNQLSLKGTVKSGIDENGKCNLGMNAFKNFNDVNFFKYSDGKDIALINFGIEEYLVEKKEIKDILELKIRRAQIVFHEIYAHVKIHQIHIDKNETTGADSDHKDFGQTFLGPKLKNKDYAGQFVQQLVHALIEENGINTLGGHLLDSNIGSYLLDSYTKYKQ